jgi:hypothetical protein
VIGPNHRFPSLNSGFGAEPTLGRPRHWVVPHGISPLVTLRDYNSAKSVTVEAFSSQRAVRLTSSPDTPLEDGDLDDVAAFTLRNFRQMVGLADAFNVEG